MNDLRGAIVLWLLLGTAPLAVAKLSPEQVQALPPPASRPVSFAQDIKPIFDASCVRCHGRGRAKGGFKLDTRETILKGGDSGATVLPGRSQDSLLIELVAGVNPDNVMPLGTGYHLSTGFEIPLVAKKVQANYATFSCMGCHSGSVTTPTGGVIHLVGAPNPLGNFAGSVNQTVNDPRYTAGNFVTALNKEPPGWVYGNVRELPQEALERRLYNTPGGAEYFLNELKFISNKTVDRFNAAITP